MYLCAVLIGFFRMRCSFCLSVFYRITSSVFFAFIESYATQIKDLAAVKSGEPNALYIGQLWIKVDAFCDLYMLSFLLFYSRSCCCCCCYRCIGNTGQVGEQSNVPRMRIHFLHMLFLFVGLLLRQAKASSYRISATQYRLQTEFGYYENVKGKLLCMHSACVCIKCQQNINRVEPKNSEQAEYIMPVWSTHTHVTCIRKTRQICVMW